MLHFIIPGHRAIYLNTNIIHSIDFDNGKSYDSVTIGVGLSESIP